MSIILDLVGAVLIGGMVLLLMVNLNTVATKSKFSSDYELRLQQNAKTFAEILNNDLRKVGYNVAGSKIITAQEKRFSFYADIDSNNVTDIVTYYLGDSSQVLSTENPKDKVLYRIVNNDTISGPSLGLTNLRFSYKKLNGTSTSTPDSIKFVKVEIWVESTDRINNIYPFTYWEMTINPRNI